MLFIDRDFATYINRVFIRIEMPNYKFCHASQFGVKIWKHRRAIDERLQIPFNLLRLIMTAFVVPVVPTV